MTARLDHLPGPLGEPSCWRALQAVIARDSQALLGAYRRQAQPEGLTLKQLRPYQPGDEPRRLDWAASARRGEPIVKELEDEHSFPVWTVVDTSLAMFWGSGGLRKIDLAMRLALTLGRCAHQADDRWGFAYGSKGLEYALQPGPGARVWRDGWLKLAQVRPLECPGNLPHLLEGFRRVCRQRSLIVLISDFPRGHWQRQLARLARDHSVIVLQSLDALDRALPPTGLTALADPESGQSGLYDLSEAAVARANALAARQRAEVAAFCQSIGAAHTPLYTDRPWLPTLRQTLLQHRHQAVRRPRMDAPAVAR